MASSSASPKISTSPSDGRRRCSTRSPPPMEAGFGTNERQRRTKALKKAAQEYVATTTKPALAATIKAELGEEGWSIELDSEDKDNQTLLFNHSRTAAYVGRDYLPGDHAADDDGYIKPRSSWSSARAAIPIRSRIAQSSLTSRSSFRTRCPTLGPRSRGSASSGPSGRRQPFSTPSIIAARCAACRGTITTC